MYETLHVANEYHTYIYIYISILSGYAKQIIGWYLLSYYIPSIIQHVSQNTKFLYNMQCVIDILYYSQKMQWSMRIGRFLETRKIRVEGTCCLEVAICLTFL